ncbi:carbohydrate kinase family protein [Mucilaginibacter glaciei]|uniref:Sugar/nucleoside kinase (Ribokinase family) n=1 Tax=Mucilaginibacter glaciei TaxID=2772109 RepID=A0A926NTJ8_9SPHI|nr:hypothetical protein [Mucilaginibacter glaciei]MBD1391504.1 hypothetical protein [Mucilaginibacter glaciei]
MKDKIQQIKQTLKTAPATLANKKVAAGFDGFVDSIVKVVNYKSDQEGTVYFNDIKEFGNYISAKSGSGFSLESEELLQKLGGNMPIMANALAQMGSPVSCVGALGVPAIAPAFLSMHPNCKLHSFTNPGFTTAMEFADGKLMLAQMTELNKANWGAIKEAIGLKNLQHIFTEADLICLVNWSELDHSNNIWQGLLADVFLKVEPGHRQFFFDLADCSKRKSEAIETAISLIQQFANYGQVTLSLNRNEANILYRTFFGEEPGDDLQLTGNKLFTALNIDTLIIHSAKISAAWDNKVTYKTEPAFIANPKFSTGAGDNFNAGYCIGTLLGLDAELSLILANSTSNRYITSGTSPDIETLDAYFSELIIASL